MAGYEVDISTVKGKNSCNMSGKVCCNNSPIAVPIMPPNKPIPAICSRNIKNVCFRVAPKHFSTATAFSFSLI